MIHCPLFLFRPGRFRPAGAGPFAANSGRIPEEPASLRVEEESMELRAYKSSDCPALAELFYNTVHTVNARDYSERQRNAWADGRVDLAEWDRTLRAHTAVVAVEGGQIVGFGDIDSTGYLDRLYVHKDFQGRGIASAICAVLETAAGAGRIVTHASITARPFFEGRGYRLVQEQRVFRHGVALKNYVMEKRLAFP